MKKLYIITLLATILPAGFAMAQVSYYLSINFEDTSTVKHVIIDTANHNNIWQIGRPAKTVFTNAYSAPNAIVTDTVLPYPVTNHSSFIITIKDPQWFQGSPSWLDFYHKYNTDTGKDGGYIEVSYDGGNKWRNIINDTIMSSCPFHPSYDTVPSYFNFYLKTDTISGGIPAFTGNSSGWTETSIIWQFCLGVKSWPPDSVMFRFNFVSDSIQTNKDGWMIDNITFYSDECGGIKHISTADYFKTHVFPNPATDKIEVSNELSPIISIEFFNLIGESIYSKPNIVNRTPITINIADFPSGVYIIQVKTAEGLNVEKFIKE